MTESDDLRDRMARTDPARDAVLTPADSPQARALLEDIMNTPDTHDDPQLDERSDTPRERDRTREFFIGFGAVAAVILAVWGGIAVFGGGDDDEPEVADPTPTTVADPVEEPADEPASTVPTTVAPIGALTLSLGQGQDPAASCIRPSAEVLAPVEMAFAGTAAVVDGERVVLDVTRWYTDDNAVPRVELTAPSGMEALTGGIAFEVGGEYLISAFGGVINYCGLSGPATPELQAIYDGAFPG